MINQISIVDALVGLTLILSMMETIMINIELLIKSSTNDEVLMICASK